MQGSNFGNTFFYAASIFFLSGTSDYLNAYQLRRESADFATKLEMVEDTRESGMFGAARKYKLRTKDGDAPFEYKDLVNKEREFRSSGTQSFSLMLLSMALGSYCSSVSKKEGDSGDEND